MSSFYISEIRITGPNVKDAVIELKNGLNIIHGPSNTGKSYIASCLDFMFGLQKDRFRIDTNTGYNNVSILVDTLEGKVLFERRFEDSEIIVSSSNPSINSGSYKSGSINDNNADNHVSIVWLRLMGINDSPKIIKTLIAERQRLTIRSIAHTFLIHEDRVFQEGSILQTNYVKTAAVSALYFLLTGELFEEVQTQEKKIITDAKFETLMNYLNAELENIYSRKSDLRQMDHQDYDNIFNKIDKLLSELSSYESELAFALKQNKEISVEINSAYDKLAETNLLSDRYQSLRSQYISDINRLNLILEAEINSDLIYFPTECPFCSGELKHEQQEPCIDAAKAEINKIYTKLNDLAAAESSIINEQREIQNTVTALEHQKKNYSGYINNNLQPKVNTLKENISAYEQSLQLQNELHFLHNQEERVIEKIEDLQAQKTAIKPFNPKDFFQGDINKEINKNITELISHESNYPTENIYFSPDKFDVIVNGKEKKSFGKGYRAFYNTVLALSFMKLLSSKGKYAPGLLVVDSPILSLKEQNEEHAPESMKSQLFKSMTQQQEYGQIIVIENEIPDIDYKNTNIITFTKDENEGRYGLLHGVRD